MFKHLLVAIDDSSCARQALAVAISLGVSEKAKLTIVHVIDPMRVASTAMGPYTSEAWLEAITKAGFEISEGASERAKAAGLEVDSKILNGPPVETIVEAARECGADGIVVGSHGRKGLARAIVGSVAEGVMRSAECPTLVVREATEAPAVL